MGEVNRSVGIFLIINSILFIICTCVPRGSIVFVYLIALPSHSDFIIALRCLFFFIFIRLNCMFLFFQFSVICQRSSISSVSHIFVSTLCYVRVPIFFQSNLSHMLVEKQIAMYLLLVLQTTNIYCQ